MKESFHPQPKMNLVMGLVFVILMGLIIAMTQNSIVNMSTQLIILTVIFTILWIIGSYKLANACELIIGDKDLKYEYGLFTKKNCMMPYSEITKAKLEQNEMEKLLNLCTLTIETPEYKNLPVQIAGIEMADAKKTFNTIAAKNKSAKISIGKSL